jgi:hypothetical protein
MDVEGLVRRWEDAEGRLYPSALVQPDRYEQYLRVVRGVADRLDSVGSVEELARRWDRGPELAGEVAVREGVRGPDLELVAGAGFLLRYRELRELARREEIRRLIGEARARGED